MTCGSSEPLVTAGDRRCPCATLATRTQRGPGLKPTSSVRERTGWSDDLRHWPQRAAELGCQLPDLDGVVSDARDGCGPDVAQRAVQLPNRTVRAVAHLW